jgi:hypothetical protein
LAVAWKSRLLSLVATLITQKPIWRRGWHAPRRLHEGVGKSRRSITITITITILARKKTRPRRVPVAALNL